MNVCCYCRNASCVVIVLFVVVIATRCAAANDFPNYRYLGMGYDIIKGNPNNNYHDPGFTYSVIKFAFTTATTTSDGRYNVPDHVQALQTRSCSYQSQVSQVTGSQSYQNALSVDVAVEGGFSGVVVSARFSASVGYRQVKQGTSQSHRIYTSARAKCIEYELAVNYQNAPLSVTDSFARAVGALPLTQDNAAYHRFIITYGSHFTIRVTMGAKMVVRSEFGEEAWSKMEETGLNVAAAAELSFAARASGGVSVETESERQHRQTFESHRSSRTESYLGSHPPHDGRWQTWAANVAASPYPVEYELAAITSLLTTKFFPGMPSDELTTRLTLLTAAYNSYCSGIPGCEVPDPDRVPVRVQQAVSTFHSRTTVSCPPTYNLLSCGIATSFVSGEYTDWGRWAIPRTDLHACECSSAAQANCVSWCTNTAVQLRVVMTGVVRGTQSANCPSGYKVWHVY